MSNIVAPTHITVDRDKIKLNDEITITFASVEDVLYYKLEFRYHNGTNWSDWGYEVITDNTQYTCTLSSFIPLNNKCFVDVRVSALDENEVQSTFTKIKNYISFENGGVNVYVNGAYKQGTPFIYIDGEWKQANIYVRNNDEWKEGV